MLHVGDPDDADAEGIAAAQEAEAARQVNAFIKKATDVQVGLLPEGVVDYVLNHQHDVDKRASTACPSKP